jgi:hypothetical protein
MLHIEVQHWPHQLWLHRSLLLWFLLPCSHLSICLLFLCQCLVPIMLCTSRVAVSKIFWMPSKTTLTMPNFHTHPFPNMFLNTAVIIFGKKTNSYLQKSLHLFSWIVCTCEMSNARIRVRRQDDWTLYCSKKWETNEVVLIDTPVPRSGAELCIHLHPLWCRNIHQWYSR